MPYRPPLVYTKFVEVPAHKHLFILFLRGKFYVFFMVWRVVRGCKFIYAQSYGAPSLTAMSASGRDIDCHTNNDPFISFCP